MSSLQPPLPPAILRPGEPSLGKVGEVVCSSPHGPQGSREDSPHLSQTRVWEMEKQPPVLHSLSLGAEQWEH